ncbi:acyl-CoA dehydrogenase family protein [Novosphingobium panipatense]|uniref:Acyl-CoA dehydrogenase, N-terminal domain n=1 Tax=Novosphingobium panipatense TaxID=428991 RepID=A0ABY1Q7W1_9SPHN|nr:acyl-CoA dehydrogenase family protein [Novosphingobium panipatense]SMP60663.1 Acyl-CoA dehydrogenase, N-terminal domain [Novosphingobium panipatense]
MDFRYTEDQLLLAEGVRDYLTGMHGPEVLRRLDEQGNRDPEIWQGLVDLGLPGLLVPEELGGMGLGLVDAIPIAIECGRACVSEPLVDTAFVAVPWLQRSGDNEALAAIAAGERKVSLPHAINPWVADGEGTPLQSVDPLRNLTTAPSASTGDPYLLDLGALMSAAQLVGVAEAMLALAVDYAKMRTQFGQPIGGFQAIKHQLASCSLAIEFARPVLARAAHALQEGAETASYHVSHAKIAATDAATLTAETAIQVFGAMGYTYEVDLHFWMKRSWALSGAWGSRGFHMKRIDDAVIGEAMPIGPEHTFA